MFDDVLIVKKIFRETPDVKTFVLNNENLIFIPGQYALVSLPDFPELENEERPFTLACSPSNDYIIFSIKEMGIVTGAMHKRLVKGNRLRLRGPFGENLNLDLNAKKICLVAGGSGITPFKSFLDEIQTQKLGTKVKLFYSNRTKNDIIYKQYFASLEDPNIDIILTLTDETVQGWNGETGRINKEMLIKHMPDYKEYLHYVCGPPPMISAIKSILKEMGIDEVQIRIEDWQLPGKHTD